MDDFEIYRSRHNPSHYVALLASDRGENAESVRASQNLAPLTRIPDDATSHLGFDLSEARKAIGKHGFYAFAVVVEPREGIV